MEKLIEIYNFISQVLFCFNVLILPWIFLWLGLSKVEKIREVLCAIVLQQQVILEHFEMKIPAGVKLSFSGFTLTKRNYVNGNSKKAS